MGGGEMKVEMFCEISGMRVPSDNDRLAPIMMGDRARAVVSTKYKKGKEELIVRFRQAREGRETMRGSVAVVATIYTSRDVQNLLKVLLDAAEEAGVIENDRDVEYILLRKHKIKRTEPEHIIIYFTGETDGDGAGIPDAETEGDVPDSQRKGEGGEGDAGTPLQGA
jgi:Holliday junction resolvase RusA-like endonuclease